MAGKGFSFLLLVTPSFRPTNETPIRNCYINKRHLFCRFDKYTPLHFFSCLPSINTQVRCSPTLALPSPSLAPSSTRTTRPGETEVIHSGLWTKQLLKLALWAKIDSKCFCPVSSSCTGTTRPGGAEGLVREALCPEV